MTVAPYRWLGATQCWTWADENYYGAPLKFLRDVDEADNGSHGPPLLLDDKR